MYNSVEAFVAYLENDKKAPANTISSYRRDLASFYAYAEERGIRKISSVSSKLIEDYLRFLGAEGKKPSTISRAGSSIRSFFRFLGVKGELTVNPAKNVHVTPHARTLPNVLTGREVDELLAQPRPDTPKGMRDKAMLELLYATGMRVTELIKLDLSDVNYEVGFVRVLGEKDERCVPLYPAAVKLLREYVDRVRSMLAYREDETALFLNLSGERISRQGFWKMLKSYSSSAGIKKDITPQTLRHSFAMHLLENGADMKVVSDMMGHTNAASVQVYNEMLRQKVKSSYANYHPHARA